MKNIKLILLIISTIVLIIFLGLYKYIHSPQYTFTKINSAINQHDWDTFSQYIDIDSIIAAEIEKSASSSENNFIKGITQLAAGNLKAALISKLKSAIENPNSTDVPELLINLASLKDKNARITSKSEGKILSVKIQSNFGFAQVPASLGITMRSEGIKYVVIGIDISEIEYRNNIVSDIYKEYYLLPIREKINSSLKVSIIKRSKGCANLIYTTCMEDLILLERRVENLTNREISEARIEMYPSEIFSKEIKYQKIDSIKNIHPNTVITVGRNKGWKFNQFSDEDKMWMYVDEKEIILMPTKIKFSDGEELEMNEYEYLYHYKDLPNLKIVAEWGKNKSLKHSDELLEWLK